MEVGHNVMHGQYDWTGNPELDGKRYEWDTACTGEDWRHSHNYEHHTFTNVLGRDRDVGYGVLRVTAAQRWHARHLLQPIYAAVLALFFQWGVGLHDLRVAEAIGGRMPWAELRTRARPFLRKATWQLGRDYVVFPALALWNAPRVLAGNALANMMRNLWSFAVIFCGHFPEGVAVYSERDVDGESRGRWYLRQLTGSANIEGGTAMHLLSGRAHDFQIERHCSRPAGIAIPGAGAGGTRDLRAVRCAVQHRRVRSSARQRREAARAVLAAGVRRVGSRSPRSARAVDQGDGRDGRPERTEHHTRAYTI